MEPTDWIEIYQLVSTYNHAIDRGDGRRFAETFLPDGILHVGARSIRGSHELNAFGTRVPLRFNVPRHVTSNLLLLEDDGVVRISATLQLFYIDVPSRRQRLAASGTYDDIAQRTEGGWRFRTRRFTFDPGTDLAPEIPL